MSTSGSSDDRRPLISDARARTGDAIRTIVDATALKTSDAFFSTLVRELAGALGVRHALIAECSDTANTQVRTLAFWSEERFLEPAVYGFTGIKCDVTVSGADEYYGVPLFDTTREIIGHLAILDATPLRGDGVVDVVMRTCAALASRELERLRAATTIASLKAEIGRLNEALDRDHALLREIADSAGLHAPATPPEPAPIGGPSTLEDVERAHILATLTQTGWVIEGPRGAARILNLHPNTLRSRMKKLGLERARHGLPPVEGV